MKDIVSVIVPVYNALPYLHRTYESLCSQTYEQLEIILLDDGSTDNSLSVCRQLAQKDGRIRVLNHKNSGASITRNRGIEEATGDFIMFMDADDILSPHAIESLLYAVQKHQADIAVGDVCVIREGEPPDWQQPKYEATYEVSTKQAYQHLASYEWWGPCAKLYRASFLRKFRFPQETLSEDYNLMVQMFHQAHICHQPGIVYAYMKRDGSLSTSAFNARSYDEVKNTYNAWKYARIHVPFFADYALKFFTESCVKVGINSLMFENRVSVFSRKQIQRVMTPNIVMILFSRNIPTKLKIMSFLMCLGKPMNLFFRYKFCRNKKTKKILFVTHTLHGGGVEQSLKNLFLSIDFSQQDITLYSLKDETLDESFPNYIKYGYIYDTIHENDSIIQISRKKIKNKIKLLIYQHCTPRTFYRLFLPKNADTEIAYIEGDCTRILSGSSSPNSKKLAWIHCDIEKHHWTAASYRSEEEEHEAYGHFDCVCSVSARALEIAQKKFTNVKKWMLTPNIIPIKEIWRKANLPFEHKTRKDRINICYVGRIEEVKGVDRLLQAYKEICTDNTNPCHLHIIGNGSQLSALQNYTNTNKIKNITFYGAKENPYPHIKNADWLICPSRSEGYGLVLAEALTIGTPVIATTCAGTAEILQYGKYGILVENSTQGIAHGLKRILTEPELQPYFKRATEKWRVVHDEQEAINTLKSLIL